MAHGRPSQFADGDKIKVLVKKNPKRPGGAAHALFDLYKPGMTVAEFLKAGGWRADIRWDTKQKFIEVGKPSPVGAPERRFKSWARTHLYRTSLKWQKPGPDHHRMCQ